MTSSWTERLASRPRKMSPGEWLEKRVATAVWPWPWGSRVASRLVERGDGEDVGDADSEDEEAGEEEPGPLEDEEA